MSAPALALAPAPAPAAPEPDPSPTTTSTLSAPPTSTLSAELPLLESARSALARDPSSTLATCAEHRARFPEGALSAERDLIELDALRRVGRTKDARTRAEAWLERDPSGLHSKRVRAILASLPSES